MLSINTDDIFETDDNNLSRTFEKMKNKYMDIINNNEVIDEKTYTEWHLLYIYFDTRWILMYVWITSDLQTRHNSHKDKHNNGGHYIASLKSRKDAEFYERFFVQKCNPYKNVSMKTDDQISIELSRIKFVNFENIKKYIKTETKTKNWISKWKQKQIAENLRQEKEETEMNNNFINFINQNKKNIIWTMKSGKNQTMIIINNEWLKSYRNFWSPLYSISIKNTKIPNGWYIVEGDYNLTSPPHKNKDGLQIITLLDNEKFKYEKPQKAMKKIHELLSEVKTI